MDYGLLFGYRLGGNRGSRLCCLGGLRPEHKRPTTGSESIPLRASRQSRLFLFSLHYLPFLGRRSDDMSDLPSFPGTAGRGQGLSMIEACIYKLLLFKSYLTSAGRTVLQVARPFPVDTCCDACGAHYYAGQGE